jgi:three-Cys-motif partner protein
VWNERLLINVDNEVLARYALTVMFDEVGYWTEVKLDIIRKYAKAYSTIMRAQAKKRGFYHIYVDAFAGAGVNISRTTGEYVLGSPLNALLVEPPFREYHFIDLSGKKIERLREAVGEQPNVYFYAEDCNEVLLRRILPRMRPRGKMKGLVLLDPYGLHYRWPVVEAAGNTKSVDLFLNFSIMDANLNALRRIREGLDDDLNIRMNAAWGDGTWRDLAYADEGTLFGVRERKVVTNDDVAEAYRQRLIRVAGFPHVPEPIPMCNSKGSVIYYLYLGSQKLVAENIITDISNKYRYRRA